VRPLPAWIDELYGHLAEPIDEAYAIVEAADDKSVTAALTVERASPAWSRFIADLRDVKTARGLRTRLLHKVTADLYAPHVTAVMRLACRIDPGAGGAVLQRAIAKSTATDHVRNALLEAAFDGGVSAATMQTLLANLDPAPAAGLWITHLGAAIARSALPTERIVARFRELADGPPSDALIQLCAAVVARHAVHRTEVKLIAGRSSEPVRGALETILAQTKSART
jgi:hypothetical protein